MAFDRMYDALMSEESGFVGELERFLKMHEQIKAAKTKARCAWSCGSFALPLIKGAAAYLDPQVAYTVSLA